MDILFNTLCILGAVIVFSVWITSFVLFLTDSNKEDTTYYERYR